MPTGHFLVFNSHINKVLEDRKGLRIGVREVSGLILFVKLLIDVVPTNPLTVTPHSIRKIGEFPPCHCATHNLLASIPLSHSRRGTGKMPIFPIYTLGVDPTDDESAAPEDIRASEQ